MAVDMICLFLELARDQSAHQSLYRAFHSIRRFSLNMRYNTCSMANFSGTMHLNCHKSHSSNVSSPFSVLHILAAASFLKTSANTFHKGWTWKSEACFGDAIFLGWKEGLLVEITWKCTLIVWCFLKLRNVPCSENIIFLQKGYYNWAVPFIPGLLPPLWWCPGRAWWSQSCQSS